MKTKLTKKTKKSKAVNVKQVNKQNIKINISLAKSKKSKKRTNRTPSIFIPTNSIPSYPLFIDQPPPQPIHYNNEPIKETAKSTFKKVEAKGGVVGEPLVPYLIKEPVIEQVKKKFNFK